MAGDLSWRGMSPRGVLLALTLVTSACASTDTAARTVKPSIVDASRDFQRSYDQTLRDDPTSFLTTVAAYYLVPGDALELVRSETGWLEATNSAPPELALQASVTSLVVRRGSELHMFEDQAELALDDRFTLGISRQEDDWRVLIHDRESKRRAEFPGVAWFPIDPAFVVEARYAPRPSREPMLLQTSRGVQKTLYVAGEAEFELAGATARLLVFAYAAEPSPEEPLLIPFRDSTSGERSYAAGRYLELAAPPGDALILDFNRATNPLCAYSEHYNCPMPPRFNTLTAAVEAGAMSPH